MGKILAFAGKDLRILLRDRSGVAFVLGFPFLFAAFFGMVFSGASGPERIPIAAVDLDQTPASRAFVARLDSLPELDVRLVADTAAAKALVRGKKCVGMLVLPKGFGERKRNPFAAGAPEIRLGFDPAERTTAGLLEGLLTKAAFEDMASLFSSPANMRKNVRAALDSVEHSSDLSPEQRRRLASFLRSLDQFLDADTSLVSASFQGFEPLRFQRVEILAARTLPPNAFAITFPQAVMYAIIHVVASFGLSVTEERNQGTLSRLLALPVTQRQILAGKALGCFVTVVGVSAALIALGSAVLHVTVRSVPLLLLSLIAIGVAFVGITMLLSVSSRSPRAVSGLTWAIMLPLAMLGGAMIPLIFMPAWLQKLSALSPMKWAILSLEGALWRGLSARELLLPWLVLVMIGLVSFVLGARLFRWRES